MSIRHRQASSSLLNVGKVFGFCFAAEAGYRGLVFEKAKRSSMEDEWKGAGQNQESLREQAR